MRFPFCKFYPRDWLADFGLRGCSLAARGLWADMLCLMAMSDRRGYLTANGEPMPSADLARRIGGDRTEVDRLLRELGKANVFSRGKDGIIFSRRMVDDARRSEEGQHYGKRGGNPALLNRRDNPVPYPKPLNSEPRTQNPEPRKEAAREACAAFAKPTADEMKAFAVEAKLDAAQVERFADYYTANGWRVGRSPMRDWKAAFRNWCRRAAEFAPGRKENHATSRINRNVGTANDGKASQYANAPGIIRGR